MKQNGWYSLESDRPNRGPNRPKQPQKQPPRPPAPKPPTYGNGRPTPPPSGPRPPMHQPPRPGGHPPMHQPPKGPQLRRIETPAAVIPAQEQAQPIPGDTVRKPDPYNDEPAKIHSLTVGDRGPVLHHDTTLHETLDTFVHEKILERAVHVKGWSASGYFEPYQSMKQYTKLSFLQTPGKRVPVTSRFSLAVSVKGTPDTSRNVRGFSTKFYTEEGNFDLLTNHVPVFLVRDAMRFPESIKSFLPAPTNNLADGNRFWDFVARCPEAMHFVTWLFSDLGTVKSLRHIRAYGVNTYVWVNAEGQRRYVKYHWIPLAGEQSIDREEAGRLAGENPDVAGQDLYDTIAKGGSAEYDLCVQLMDPEDEKYLEYDPLDDTKIWSEQQYPLIKVGKLTLNKNPGNYMEETEKLAFAPTNLLPGAELSNDKMLQGRATIYWDAQRRRLGPDFRKIPVNQEKSGWWSADKLVTSGEGEYTAGIQMRSDLEKQDDFAQAGQRYRSLDETQKAHLVDNIASGLYAVDAQAKATVMDYFRKSSEELAGRIEQQMKKYSQN